MNKISIPSEWYTEFALIVSYRSVFSLPDWFCLFEKKNVFVLEVHLMLEIVSIWREKFESESNLWTNETICNIKISEQNKMIWWIK